MKKLIALFLILIICFSNTEMYQLLKTPKLISHYLQHKNKTAVSFYSFIKIHYSGNHGKDNDANDDRQLPFKSDECINNSILCLPAAIVSVIQPESKPGNSYISVYRPFHPSDLISTIFQPPRFRFF